MNIMHDIAQRAEVLVGCCLVGDTSDSYLMAFCQVANGVERAYPVAPIRRAGKTLAEKE